MTHELNSSFALLIKRWVFSGFVRCQSRRPVQVQSGGEV